jgi:hypothetical protein
MFKAFAFPDEGAAAAFKFFTLFPVSGSFELFTAADKGIAALLVIPAHSLLAFVVAGVVVLRRRGVRRRRRGQDRPGCESYQSFSDFHDFLLVQTDAVLNPAPAFLFSITVRAFEPLPGDEVRINCVSSGDS